MRSIWFDRKFDFNFPPSLYWDVLERLRGTPARTEELVGSIPPTVLIDRYDDRWSIQEHCGHLLDLEELHYGRLEDFLGGAEKLRSADLQNQKTVNANHNEREIGMLLAEFRRARMRFVGKLESLDDEEIIISALHPRLEVPMRVVDMIFFAAEHDDHHLASISEIYQRINSIES